MAVTVIEKRKSVGKRMICKVRIDLSLRIVLSRSVVEEVEVRRPAQPDHR